MENTETKLCKCGCGTKIPSLTTHNKERNFIKGHYNRLFPVKHTKKTRKKMSLSHQGSKHWNWKGGINPINDNIRKSLEYRLWRESVFERDNYTCVWCGARNGNGKSITLNADHIKPFCDYPALRFAIDNGRTLCVPCHRKTDTFSGRGNKRKHYIKVNRN